MQTTYEGVHSIKFSSNGTTWKDTWEDWGLVPTSLPVVSMPNVKTNTIEVPGMNGVVDLTDIPLGMPTYSNRNGSWSFYIANDVVNETWDRTYAKLASYFHGKKRKCVLSDDLSHYYEGRFSLDTIKSEKSWSTITIKYDLHPFKWMRWTTCEDWQWNPFDFIDGNINQQTFKDIQVIPDSQNYRTWNQNELGNVPVTPIITVNSVSGNGMALHINNEFNNLGVSRFELSEGVNNNPLIMLACPDYEDITDIAIFGEGTISFDFRPGRL